MKRALAGTDTVIWQSGTKAYLNLDLVEVVLNSGKAHCCYFLLWGLSSQAAQGLLLTEL